MLISLMNQNPKPGLMIEKNKGMRTNGERYF